VTDRTGGEVVNISRDEEITIEELGRLVKEKTYNNRPIRYIPYEEAFAAGFEDMQRRVPCLEKLVVLTGYRPSPPPVADYRSGCPACAGAEGPDGLLPWNGRDVGVDRRLTGGGCLGVPWMTEPT
jgi:hypothetical protein